MKRLFIAPTIILMLSSPCFAIEPPRDLKVVHTMPEPICTIERRDASAGVVYVRIASDYCDATDSDVEDAAQALYDTLVSLPEVYEFIEVVNECELKARFSLTELETILNDLERI